MGDPYRFRQFRNCHGEILKSSANLFRTWTDISTIEAIKVWACMFWEGRFADFFHIRMVPFVHSWVIIRALFQFQFEV